MLPQTYRNRLSAGVIFCVLCTIALGAAMVAAAASTPVAAMKAYYEAAKAKDYAALKEVVSDEYLKELAKAPFPLERMLQPLTERVPPTAPSMRNEKISGDRATLEVRNHETQQWETVRFVKQKGSWKLALHEMGSPR